MRRFCPSIYVPRNDERVCWQHRRSCLQETGCPLYLILSIYSLTHTLFKGMCQWQYLLVVIDDGCRVVSCFTNQYYMASSIA